MGRACAARPGDERTELAHELVTELGADHLDRTDGLPIAVDECPSEGREALELARAHDLAAAAELHRP